HPRGLLARVHAERNGAVEREGLVLAEEVVRRGVRALDGAGLGGVEHTESRDQLTGRVHRDLELAAGSFGDILGEGFGAAVQGGKRLREARGEAPANVLLGTDDGRRRGAGEDAGDAGMLQKLATFHGYSFPVQGVNGALNYMERPDAANLG